MSIQVSAVVCTHNRAGYLRKALQSLTAQTLDPASYEVLVVDNASTDNTRKVFDEFADRPNWRYLYEPVIGLSRARNTGWHNAHGEYVAYLDDDAVACHDWLAKLLEAFETIGPRPGCVGGRCLPEWEAPQPAWLSDNLLIAFSIFHYADRPIIVSGQQFLSGCNIAYPRNVLQALGGFREDLGRHGTNLLSNDESYLRWQLDAHGYCSVYHPEALVLHHIPASRLTKKWFRDRAFWQGVSDANMLYSQGRLPFFLRIGLTIKKAIWGLVRLGLRLVATSSAIRFKRQMQLSETAGFVSGLWRRGLPEATAQIVESKPLARW